MAGNHSNNSDATLFAGFPLHCGFQGVFDGKGDLQAIELNTVNNI